MRHTQRRDLLMDRLTAAWGAARLSALAPTRADRRAVHRMIRDGLVLADDCRVIYLPGTDRGIVAARRLRGLIGCAHGLHRLGLPLREAPGRVHLLVPADPGRRSLQGAGRVVTHRLPGLVVDPLGSPYAQAEDLLVAYLHCATELDALIALDAALRAGLAERAQLSARLRGPRNGRVRATLARARPEARSILETIARYDLEEAGAPPQVAVPSPAGELDLVLGSLDVETDGHAFHSRWEDWSHDRHRDQQLLARGITPLRLTSRQVLARLTVGIVRPVAQRLGCWPPGSSHAGRAPDPPRPSGCGARHARVGCWTHD